MLFLFGMYESIFKVGREVEKKTDVADFLIGFSDFFLVCKKYFQKVLPVNSLFSSLLFYLIYYPFL